MATAYLRNGSHQEILLEEIASIDINGENVVMKSLFGKQKEIQGVIRELDFLNSTVYLEEHVSREDSGK